MLSNELLDVLTMGGYATYVWPVFGMAFLVLAANYFIPMRRRRRILDELRRANESLT